MSLPPGFLDELRTRVSIAQVVGRAVTWDLRKSNQGKGDFWAPCPFHQEKTASFHVDDRKGFYYCFGCQAKGDTLKFLQETQNMPFMEAVETLAREAGMTMPEREPGDRQRADRRTTLTEVMEQAVRYYRMQLMGGQAAEARAYLDRRGLTQAQREHWGIGFAPDTRHGLWQHLTQAGIAPDLIIEAGLCARPDDGGQPYDRFRGRIMFPIRDARDRCIAFGGRAMAEDARAKYLNSPETPLFDKGRTLYNIGPARAAMGKGTPLIVAEGYMDVIALVNAGFEGAVAPLGTAITEDQLRLMWRMSDEPMVALDGDTAGLRAGHRLADLALPLITAGHSLRFVLLPGGQDPDDVLRASGAAAMRALIDRAVPMAKLLWEREIAGQVFDSPERRAALDQRLNALLGRLQDPSLREHYTEDFRQQRRALFSDRKEPFRAGKRYNDGQSGGGKGTWRKPAPEPSLPGTRGSLLAAGTGPADEDLRAISILTTLAAQPSLLLRFDDRLLHLETRRPDLQDLQRALLRVSHSATPPDAATLAQTLGDTLTRHLSLPYLQTLPLRRARAEAAEAIRFLDHEFGVLRATQGGQRETMEAMEQIAHLADEGLTWRLEQAKAERERAVRIAFPDTTDDSETAPKDGKSLLDQMITQEVWVKKDRSRPK
ncbi:DNA primase [Pararhodobacter sp.]|uniref:DNA primase n=1 Tax=Pararhodobacter sp. TaxID=2127056 RepID=UPI002AFE81EC|nr:DNA primase [Pararhodobacter sp.]